MNKKGFTLIELLAVLVVLSIVAGFASTSVVKIMNASREKSEAAFVETIKDAVDVYITGGEAKSKDYSECSKWGSNYDDYEYVNISFEEIVNSKYRPINKKSLVNPANKKRCYSSTNGVKDILVTIYRDKKTFKYYYKIDKSLFASEPDDVCFNNYTKGNTFDKNNYISNLTEPGYFLCGV